MQDSTKQHKTEQSQSPMTANEIINSAYGETLQTREQYDDSPIWIIEQGNKAFAVIGEYKIYEDKSIQAVQEELENPRLKTICTIIAVISDKVYTENERIKKTNT